MWKTKTVSKRWFRIASGERKTLTIDIEQYRVVIAETERVYTLFAKLYIFLYLYGIIKKQNWSSNQNTPEIEFKKDLHKHSNNFSSITDAELNVAIELF